MNFRITLTVLIALFIPYAPVKSTSMSKFLLDEGVGISTKYARKFFSTSQKNMNINQSTKIEIPEFLNFKGSLPKKVFEEKDLMESSVITRILKRAIPLNNEGTLLRIKDKLNEKESTKHFSLLRKPNFLPDSLGFIFDRRKIVNHPHLYPWNLSGYVLSEFNSPGPAVLSRGSGMIIGPSHVLTSAHVIFDEDNKIEPNKVSFLVGWNNEKFLFDINVSKKIIHPNYLQNLDKDYDYAILELEQNIGDKTGWASLGLLDEQKYLDDSFSVHITGYPAYKRLSSYIFSQEQDMFDMEGKFTKIEPKRLYYDIDTSGGQSGSGIWNQIGKDAIVNCYGVHTRGYGVFGNNGGVFD